MNCQLSIGHINRNSDTINRSERIPLRFSCDSFASRASRSEENGRIYTLGSTEKGYRLDGKSEASERPSVLPICTPAYIHAPYSEKRCEVHLTALASLSVKLGSSHSYKPSERASEGLLWYGLLVAGRTAGQTEGQTVPLFGNWACVCVCDINKKQEDDG